MQNSHCLLGLVFECFFRFLHAITLQAIDIHNIRCLEPFLPLYDHLKFWGFWDWTGNISWNRVIDHRVLHQLTTFLLKAIYFNEKWNDLVCIRILQHSVELYNCTFMLSPAKWIKGRRRCWDRWTGWASKCRLRRGELWAWDQRRHKRMVEAKHLLPVWWDCGS